MGATSEEVRRVMGEPDRVIRPEELARLEGEKVFPGYGNPPLLPFSFIYSYNHGWNISVLYFGSDGRLRDVHSIGG